MFSSFGINFAIVFCQLAFYRSKSLLEQRNILSSVQRNEFLLHNFLGRYILEERLIFLSNGLQWQYFPFKDHIFAGVVNNYCFRRGWLPKVRGKCYVGKKFLAYWNFVRILEGEEYRLMRIHGSLLVRSTQHFLFLEGACNSRNPDSGQ